MALIVETGAGLSNADSYLSVADADSYHASHSESTDWSGSTDAVKEQSLRLATQYLDANYGDKWRGTKGSSEQSLSWPRSNAVDDDGYVMDSDDLPARLENAVAELALKVVEADTLLDDISEPGTIKREKKKLGPMEKEVEYMGGKSQVKKYPLIEALLRPLIENSSQMARG